MLSGLTVRASSARADRLWLAADTLYELFGGALYRWDVGEVHAVAALEERVLAATADAVLEIDPLTEDIVVHELGLGVVHGMAASGVRACLATDSGLVVREPDGRWLQHVLSDDPSSPVPAHAVTIDGRSACIATTAIGVVKLEREVVGVAPTISSGTAIAVDVRGDVWVGSGTDVVGLFVGAPPSYATEAQPLFASYCSGPCHAGGENAAPPIAFDDYATAVAYGDRVVARITNTASPMPPRTATPLPAEAIDTLVRWQLAGAAE